MVVSRLHAAIVILGVALGVSPGKVFASPVNADARCQGLASADFTRVVDAPTQIASTTLVHAVSRAHDYCLVQGYVAPQVGFELRLPVSNWNGKFLQVGNGG